MSTHYSTQAVAKCSWQSPNQMCYARTLGFVGDSCPLKRQIAGQLCRLIYNIVVVVLVGSSNCPPMHVKPCE